MDECNELGCTYTFCAPPGPTGPTHPLKSESVK